MFFSRRGDALSRVDDDEARGCVALPILSFLFLFSGLYSWNELTYFLRGASAQAEVLRVWEFQEPRRHGSVTRTGVEFRYPVAGELRIERDTLSADWLDRLAPGQTASVEYLPFREKSARLAGNRAWGALLTFGTISLALLVFLVKVWREARGMLSTPATWKKKARGEF